MTDLIGRNIGQYRIVEQLGIGGMATVYKAYQPAMDRYVAIKVSPDYLARDPAFRARFLREAKTLAHLEHPHILPVYDAGEDDGLPYFVMRCVEGGTLRELIVNGPLPLDRALRLVAEVADALGYAHHQGVTHRDVKTANVLVDQNGVALLTDFGIAKVLEESNQLTGTGVALGTPYYMAPEQVQGKPVDGRTDIYSLGVMLYELVTGRRPFVAETPLAVSMMHVNDPLPLPRLVNPAVPEAVERIILRAMAKDPADRFQTAEEFASALRALLNESTNPPDLTVPFAVSAAAGGAKPLAVANDGTVGPGAPVGVYVAELPSSPAQTPKGVRSRRTVFAGLAVLAVAVVAVALFVLRPFGAPVAASPTVQAKPTSTGSGAVTQSGTSALPSPTTPPTASSIRSVARGSPPAPNTWTAKQPLPAARNDLAAVTGPDGRIYAIGGTRGGAIKTVEAYTPSTNTWVAVASLPTARNLLAAATGADGRIYAIGGFDNTVLNTVEAYSPTTNRWTNEASMPTARESLAAVRGPDGRIYAIGGMSGGTTLNTVEAYTPTTNTWTTLASLPIGRYGLAAVAGPDGRIYAIGGGPGSSGTVQAYTPGTNSWTSAANMLSARLYLAAANGLDGRIYAIGGVNGVALSSAEAYTPSTNQWTAVASMPTARSGLAAATDQAGGIYALGGREPSGPLAAVELYEPGLPGGVVGSPTAAK